MKKKIFIVALFLVFSISAILLCACKNDSKDDDVPKIIDASREYQKQTLSNEQKNIADKVIIKGYYTSGDYKIVNVISNEGYAGDVELLVLLNGTTVEKIMGINIKETADYGAKCFKDVFLSQFYNRDLKTMEPLLEKEDPYSPGDIIIVTHATKTSRAVIKAMNATALFIKSL